MALEVKTSSGIELDIINAAHSLSIATTAIAEFCETQTDDKRTIQFLDAVWGTLDILQTHLLAIADAVGDL